MSEKSEKSHELRTRLLDKLTVIEPVFPNSVSASTNSPVYVKATVSNSEKTNQIRTPSRNGVSNTNNTVTQAELPQPVINTKCVPPSKVFVVSSGELQNDINKKRAYSVYPAKSKEGKVKELVPTSPSPSCVLTAPDSSHVSDPECLTTSVSPNSVNPNILPVIPKSVHPKVTLLPTILSPVSSNSNSELLLASGSQVNSGRPLMFILKPVTLTTPNLTTPEIKSLIKNHQEILKVSSTLKPNLTTASVVSKQKTVLLAPVASVSSEAIKQTVAEVISPDKLGIESKQPAIGNSSKTAPSHFDSFKIVNSPSTMVISDKTWQNIATTHQKSLLRSNMKPIFNSSSSSTSTSSSLKANSKVNPNQTNLCLVVPTVTSDAEDAAFDGYCKILASLKHPGRQSAYNNITRLLMEKHENSELVEKLQMKVLPIALYDIKNLHNDADMDGALEFLGNFLQVSKLEAVMEDSVIKTLTLKILKTPSKLISKKAMWCLAQVSYREDLPKELLITMLGSALLYLNECPPIPSLGTVCEALNVAQHLHHRSPNFFLNNLEDIVKEAFPLLFHEVSRVRELALGLLKPLASTIAEKKLLNDICQHKYRQNYHSRLSSLIMNESVEGIMLWRFLIEAFGDALHTNNNLLNDLLKVEESALKSNNYDYRLCGLQSWRWLISCFARNPILITQRKRLKLLMVPFTSSESKTELLARTKIELWWHVLTSLGLKTPDYFEEVTLICLNFCFGGPNHPHGAIDAYPNLSKIATTSLIGILSPAPKFSKGGFVRSVPFVSSKAFFVYREDIRYVSERAFTSLSEEDGDLFDDLFSVYLQRCSETDSSTDHLEVSKQLEQLTAYLMDLPISKPNLNRVVLSCFLRFLDIPVLFNAFLKKIKMFLIWPCTFETNFPADLYEAVIDKCYETGVKSSPDKIIAFVNQIAVSLEAVKIITRAGIVKITLARQWSRLVNLLINSDPTLLLQVRKTLLFFPLSIINEMRSNCEDVWAVWSSYFRIAFQHDQTVLKKFRIKTNEVFSIRGNEMLLIENALEFAIESILPISDVIPGELAKWIQAWTTLCISIYNNHSQSSSRKAIVALEVLGAFIAFLLERITTHSSSNLASFVVKQIQASTTIEKLAQIEMKIDKIVSQRTGLSCKEYFRDVMGSENKEGSFAPVLQHMELQELPLSVSYEDESRASTSSLASLTSQTDNRPSHCYEHLAKYEDQAEIVSLEAEAIVHDPQKYLDRKDRTETSQVDLEFGTEVKCFIGSVADFDLVVESSPMPAIEIDELQSSREGPTLENLPCNSEDVALQNACYKSPKPLAEVSPRPLTNVEDRAPPKASVVERRRSSRPPKPAKWRLEAEEQGEMDEEYDHTRNKRTSQAASLSPLKRSAKKRKSDQSTQILNSPTELNCLKLSAKTLQLIQSDSKLCSLAQVILHRI